MSETNTDNRPNILLLLTDQQRFDTIAAAGNSHMKTPNLDRLVEQGCLFENAYTPNPVCVPARYQLITGTTEKHHRIVTNTVEEGAVDGLPTLPGVLSDKGYFTAAVGKMHFTPPRNHHGFLEMHLMEEIPEHRCDDAYAEWLEEEGYGDVRNVHGSRPLIYHAPQKALVDAEHHGTNWVAERTIELINRNAGRRPFFIECGWIKPHPPWNIPDEWWGHYDDVELPEPIPVSRMAPMPTGNSNWFGDNDSRETTRREQAAYYTSISMVDAAIGKLLDHLEKIGQLDNTMVIFASDHGEMLKDHGLFQKMVPYDSAARIPFVVRWPERVKAGSRDRRFVDLMDIMPTAFDAAGISLDDVHAARPFDPAGSSVLSLDEEGGRDRTTQRVAHNCLEGRWVMQRDERYKYVHFANGGIEWFFDLKEDPQELKNLVGTDALPMANFERLQKLAVEQEERWGPEGGVVDGKLFEIDYVDPNPAVLCGKYPHWSNLQLPDMGDGTPDEEAELLAQQIKHALSWAEDDYAATFISEPLWYEHFFGVFRDRGVSEAKIKEVAELLGI